MTLAFLPYNKNLTERARENRKNPTKAESKIWHEVLRMRQFANFKFLRQKPIDNYIVDFYCSELRLVIEVDGDSHAETVEYDEVRTKVLESPGLHVIRFTNDDVFGNIEGVFEELVKITSCNAVEIHKLFWGYVMTAVSLKQQKQGELIASGTIEGVAKAIAENFNPEKIILFGSYASGTPTPDSDLDFLVVMDLNQPRYRRSGPLQLMFKPYPCAMDILVYTPEEVTKWNGAINHIVTIAHKTGRTLYERHS